MNDSMSNVLGRNEICRKITIANAIDAVSIWNLLMIHGSHPMSPYASRAEGYARGRQRLVQLTRQDFGYDLHAWHDYLTKTNAGGTNGQTNIVDFLSKSNRLLLIHKGNTILNMLWLNLCLND